MYNQLFFCILLMPILSLANWSKQADDNLKVELGIISPTLSFDIKVPKEISLSKIKYQPNTQSKTALGLSYRNIGASISSTNPTSDENNLKYGKSKSTDLQFRFFGKRTYEFFYQTYQGYYIDNSADIDSSYGNSSTKIQRPDIKTKNYGINFYWNLNEKDFSQAIAYDQMGTQKDSAWGLSWLIHASQSSIEGESQLVPQNAALSFGDLASITHLHRNTLATGMGIGGIASWSDLYVAALLAVGFGYQGLTYESVSLAPGKDSITGSYASGRLGLGYNGKKNIFGIQLLTDSVTSTLLKGEITGSAIELKVFYAYRFDGVNLGFLNYISAWFD